MKACDRRHKRSSGGFTLMETLVAVVVLVILMGITFVPVASLASNLKMTQLDNYAKSVYQAAQNRLVSMKASGNLVELQTAIATNNSNQKIQTIPSDYPGDSDTGENWKNLYYITSSDSNADALIMKAAVISQGIISDGSYIIEMDPVSGEVYGVFYSDSPGLTYEQACAQGRDRALRASAKIGYYGGFSTSLSPDDLPKVFEPIVEFVNHEELYVNIDCPGLAAAVLTQQYLTVDVTLSDASGEVWTSELVGGQDFDLSISQTTIQMILDSTRPGLSFASITGGQLRAGDDIDVSVSITYQDPAGRRVITETPGTDKANSLFGSIVPDEASGTTTINVSSVRHLNNLYDATYTMPNRAAAGNIVIAQTSDIGFNADVWKYDRTDISDNAISQISYEANGEAVINPLSSINPINNSILLNTGDGAGAVINGAGFSIANFVVSSGGSGGTGLFAATDGAMSDIHLVNMRVSGDDNTGSLVGAHYGGAVTNCTVIDSVVNGGSNTGGLIGACKSAAIDRCSVRLSDEDASGARRGNMDERVDRYTVSAAGGSSNIGGLIGYVEDNDGNEDGTTIRNSFAAINVNADASSYVAGFVGRIEAGTINAVSTQNNVSNCYSSGDVFGDSYTAGFTSYLGPMAYIDSCYTTSNVTGWSQSAGFLSRPANPASPVSTNVTNSRAYGRVLLPNGEVDAMGAYGFSSGWPSDYGNSFLTQMGYNEDLYYQRASDTYSSFYRDNSVAVSHPYSDKLADHKNDGYAFPFEMCTDLDHYGNWPEFNAVKYSVSSEFAGSYVMAQNKAATYYLSLPYDTYNLEDFKAWLSSADYEDYYPVIMTLQSDSSASFANNTVVSKIINATPYSTLPNSSNHSVGFGDFANHTFAAGTELTIKVAPATYMVEWLNGDDSALKTESIYYGYEPQLYLVDSAYEGTKASVVPSKDADSSMKWESYCFDMQAAGSNNGWVDAGLSLKDGVLTRTMTPEFKVVPWEQQMLAMMGYGDEGNPALWGEYSDKYQRKGYIVNNLSGKRISKAIAMNSEGASNSKSAARWSDDYLAAHFGVSPRFASYRLSIRRPSSQYPTVILTDPLATDAATYPRGISDNGETVDTAVGEAAADGAYESSYRLYWGNPIQEAGQIANVIIYDLGRAAHGEPAWHKAKVTVGYENSNNTGILMYYTGDSGKPDTVEYVGDWYEYSPPPTS